MKTKKIAFFILMFLPLVVSAVCYFFLPAEIPIHIGVTSLDNEMGSKISVLYLPAIIVLFGSLTLILGTRASKKEHGGKNNFNVSVIIGIITLAILNVLNAFMLYMDFIGAKSFDDLPFDIYKVIFILFGIMLIIEGNIMPKTKINSYLGLRTAWSMHDEESWKKCQHFGGILLIIAGIIMVITSILTSGGLCLALGLLNFFFLIPIALYGSVKVVTKKNKKDTESQK